VAFICDRKASNMVKTIVYTVSFQLGDNDGAHQQPDVTVTTSGRRI